MRKIEPAKIIYLLIFILINTNSLAQIFTEQTSISIVGVNGGSVDWGDYDNDGDLDILLTGNDTSRFPISKIYKNNGDNSFTEQTGISLIGVDGSSVDWGDYDNDGDLDILLTGGWDPVSVIYKNNEPDSSGFTEQTNIALTGISDGSAAWGDYNNDGNLDILLTGNKNPGGISVIYKNNGDNTFDEQTSIELTDVQSGSVDWGDYDGDGDLDILLTGKDNNSNSVTKIYKNNGDNTFSEQTDIALTSVFDGSSVAWGDYDNDGDLDILLTGVEMSKIYKNNGDNSFTEQSDISLIGLGSGPSVSWGDYDNDGDLDILLSGSWISKIYKNYGDDSFTEQTDISLTGVVESSVAWGDYDNDGDLDILLTGRDNNNYHVSKIYKNNSSIANAKPESPDNLISSVAGNRVSFSWDKAIDAETAQAGLSYNLYVSTTSAGTDICSPHADLSTGYRKIVEKGNISNNSYTIKDLEIGTYYWSVQAIDHNFSGSDFAIEGSFSVTFTNSISPVDDQILMPDQDGIQLTVSETESAESWQWKYSNFPGGPYNNILEGETSISYTPRFSEFATYYVVCVSTKDGISVTSNEVKIELPQFSEQPSISFIGNDASAAAWGDYDNDEDLDILITGGAASGDISRIYKNNAPDSSGFTVQTNISLIGVAGSSAAWGDYNNDGFLDILLAGDTADWSDSKPSSKIYKNNGDNSFTEQTDIFLTGVYGSVAWSDFDQDGDLDCILAGYDQFGDAHTILYQNVNNDFIKVDINLRGGQSLAVADYNKDSYPDIIIAGKDINDNLHTSLYKNNGDNTFSDQAGIVLTGVSRGSVAWGDYNNDGDLDILLSGLDKNENPVSRIYKYNGNNTFSEQTSIDLTGVYESSVAWGDYDNDGDLDILLTGDGNSKIYKNNGDNTFTEQTGNLLSAVYNSCVEWGDYDNDGDLDILLTGWDKNENHVSKIYKNNNFVKNTKPENPVNLRHKIRGTQVKLEWDKANDAETSTNSLSYNVKIGTSSGASDIVSSMSLENGFIKIPDMGNTFLNNEYIINNLDTGIYYWSVQTVDNGFLASEFSEEESFTVLPAFTEDSSIHLNGVCQSSVIWGDYDNDGDLDILLSGNSAAYPNNVPVSKIYKNNGDASFTEQTSISLTGVFNGSVAWGDYDNDGDLDILLTGYDNNYNSVSLIYKNNGDNTFSEQTGISLAEIPENPSLTWCDYDNDGDLDIMMSGRNEYDNSVLKIYKNNSPESSGFTEQTDINIPSGAYDYEWGDYDNDGDLDILFINFGTLIIYINNGDNSFTEQTGILFPAIHSVCIVNGDYDNDGDLDILISGQDNNQGNVLNICRNDGNNVFTDIGTDIRKVSGSSVAWGDYDNDGFLDILIAGQSGNIITKVYRNNHDNTFSEQIGISLTGVVAGSVAWGDYDNDGDLDILLTGSDNSSNPVSKIYTNNTNYGNQQAIAPSNLQSKVSGFDIKLSWDKASDPDCLGGGLYYNLRVGTTPGSIDIMTPMANLASGYRNMPAISNAQCDTFWIIKNIPPRENYYWSVQAVDQSFMGGAWSEERSFTIHEIFVDFTVENNICADQNVSFTDNSVGNITNWHWIFGDGGESIIQNPNHLYTEAGIYDVVLELEYDGNVYTKAKQITVSPGPDVDFSFEIVALGNLTPFVNNSELNGSEILEWMWDFDDGNTYNNENPENHKFQYEGRYDVKLYAKTTNNCEDSIIKVVSVCLEALQKPDIYVKGPNVVYFACSNDSANYYKWYRENEILQGAVEYIYVAKSFGNYRVEISIDDICYIPSDVVDYSSVTSIDNPNPFTNLVIYPNPTPGLFTIEMNNNLFGELRIFIYSNDGKEISNTKFYKTTQYFNNQVDLTGLDSDLYIILLSLDTYKAEKKLIIE